MQYINNFYYTQKHRTSQSLIDTVFLTLLWPVLYFIYNVYLKDTKYDKSLVVSD